MSATSADIADKDAGTETLVELFDNINQAKADETQRPGVFAYFIRNPLMAAGMGATGYFMFKGIRAASKGESHNLAEMLQKRVVGQFGTLAVIMGSFAYFMARTPDAKAYSEQEGRDIANRALLNYTLAQERKGES